MARLARETDSESRRKAKAGALTGGSQLVTVACGKREMGRQLRKLCREEKKMGREKEKRPKGKKKRPEGKLELKRISSFQKRD